MPPVPLTLSMAESAMAVDETPAGIVRSVSGGMSTTPSKPSAMMQVVDYEEEFNKKLEAFLRENGIASRGFDYHVAAIMGPQSSGKSTLLNLLFGTGFRTMNAESGRYQVTQGVWLGRDDARGVVVMDLEGTDSRERGEDAASFERKSALFALALAEVLIVNIWSQDVGRFNAANLSLLKTVLELDLQLFFGAQNSAAKNATASPSKKGIHKTRLLFVLRDHVSSPLERLESTLRTDVDNIWNAISKPEGAQGAEVTDYFDLSFFSLPHKVLMPKEFAQATNKLRDEFAYGNMFLDDYKRGVAADGFSTYAESVWETIRENKELDIPSQKEMLAHVRCEQIARDAMDEAEKVFKPLEQELYPGSGTSGKPIENLFRTLLKVVVSALSYYDDAAYRYSASVACLKGKDLREKLGSDCKALFDTQLSIASENALSNFQKELSSPDDIWRTKKASTPWKNWGSVSSKAKENALAQFDRDCAAEDVEPGSDDSGEHPLWFAKGSSMSARNRLEATLNFELERATIDVIAKARDYCLKTFRDSFKPALSTVLDSASDDVWERVSEVASVAWEKTSTLSQNVFGEGGLELCTEEVDVSIEDRLKPECYEAAIEDIKDALGAPSSFLLRMTKKFDDEFRFDERGVPRTFGPTEDIESLFIEAREEGEKLVDLLGEVKIDGILTELRMSARSIDMEASQFVIFESHVRNDLREKLRKQAGAVFVEARRAQEAAKITTRIPAWLFVLLIILGWNEILMVLRSPLLLLLVLVVAPALYVAYVSDSATLLVPAMRTMLAPVVEKAKNFIDQADAQPPPVIPEPREKKSPTASISDTSEVSSSAQ